MSRRWSRRSWLKTAGVATAAAAGSPLVLRSRAQGADPIPKRVAFFYLLTGGLPRHWDPVAPAGMSEPTERDFELGPAHEPLQPYKGDLILFENLDMVSKRLDGTDGGNAHNSAATHALVADDRAAPERGNGPSIDQLIAQRLNPPDAPITRIPHLGLIAASWRNDAYNEDNPTGGMDGSYSNPEQRSQGYWDPRIAWQHVFPEPPSDEARAVAQRSRMFDFVRQRFGSMPSGLPRAHRDKLEQHRESVSQLERRLGLSTDRSIFQPTAESVLGELYGTRPDFGYPDGDEAQASRQWSLTADLNMEIGAAALHADATRVLTFQLQDPPAGLIDYTPDTLGSGDVHDLLHDVNGRRIDYENGKRDGFSADEREAEAAVERLHVLQMEKLRRFLDLLANKTEIDGSRLLDHTMVVVCSQIGYGSHDTTKLPWLTAGNVTDGRGDPVFRTGRYIRFDRTDVDAPDEPYNIYLNGRGRAHNDLFVSVANGMGVDIDCFGNPDVCTGPIEEMR